MTDAPERPRWNKLLWILLGAGPVLLFIAASAYGVLEVHSSTDTWIGLAAGRQILTSDSFPTQDTFSIGFEGQTWYNQNWLTHVFQYWLYDSFSPDAVILGTWAVAASIFIFTLLASYWRAGTWLGAFVAASITALGCRDFLSARPATTGFFCIAALWALICAIEGQRNKYRWWPIVLLLPLLVVWGNAHGSFVFGYGVLALYVGHWFVVRTIAGKFAPIYSLAIPLLLILVGGIKNAILPEMGWNRPEQVLQIGETLLKKSGIFLVFFAFVGYCAYWASVAIFRPRLAVRDKQIGGIVAVVVLSVVLLLIFGPFGAENFTHGQKVAGSDLWRSVSEWNSPLARGKHFPPVWRFWMILFFSMGLLAASWITMLIMARSRTEADESDRPTDGALATLVEITSSPERSRKKKDRQTPSVLAGLFRAVGLGFAADRLQTPPIIGRRHTSLFDVAVIVIGLGMTFWARRFAPIYFIYAAPIFLTWITQFLGRLHPVVIRNLAGGALLGTWVLAGATAFETGKKAYREIYLPDKNLPDAGLLEVVTTYQSTPHEGVVYLGKNDLPANVFTGWTQAGIVMFYAPNAHLFMDGRAQQVYDERTYLHYRDLTNRTTPAHRTEAILFQSRVDTVLLRFDQRFLHLRKLLDESPEWAMALLGTWRSVRIGKKGRVLPIPLQYAIYVRRDSETMRIIRERIHAGTEWRPDGAGSLVTRGMLWAEMDPPDLEKSVADLRAAVDRDVSVGTYCFPYIVRNLIAMRRVPDAKAYVQRYFEIVNDPKLDIRQQERVRLIQTLRDCWDSLKDK